MKKPTVIPKGCFWAEEKQKIYMIRCPKCEMENYAPNVASGICTWCGWEANKDNYYKEEKNGETLDKI